jgi:hypothetical protein
MRISLPSIAVWCALALLCNALSLSFEVTLCLIAILWVEGLVKFEEGGEFGQRQCQKVLQVLAEAKDRIMETEKRLEDYAKKQHTSSSGNDKQ